MLAMPHDYSDSWESDSVAPMTDPIAFGDDLAMLSLRVARELDRKSHGQSINPKIFSDFRTELSRASGVGEPNVTAFLNSDPTTTEVFAQAVRGTSAEPVSDVGSLNSAVLKIIEFLAKADEGLSDQAMHAVKMFCLSLHKSMMAQKLPPLYEERAFEDELRFVR
jgi:hypothetical protein